MFNKLKTGLFGESKTKALVNMGFSPTQAHEALSATNGDVNRAAELLLSQDSTSTPMRQEQQYAGSTPPSRTDNEEDEDLRRVMEESARISQSNSGGAARDRSSKGATAASIRAGQAAADRAQNSSRFKPRGRKAKTKVKATSEKKSTAISNTLSPSSHVRSKPKNATTLSIQHPDVKIPTQMKDKTKEEQILRCTKRISPHPLAVDTLIRSLNAIRTNPSDSKYRNIDKNNPGFKRALQDVPGAHDLLLAVNFRPVSSEKNKLIMHAADVDYALLYLATSALEKVKDSSVEYRDAKRLRQFDEEVRRIQTGRDISGEEEAIKRAAFIAKCPTEPLQGAGALLQLRIGNDIKLQRRFDGDDTLQDVIHWIAGGCGSIIPEKLTSREWCLVDLNRYPIVPIDTKANKDRTLQFIGCWPSGRLAVRPSSDEWKQGQIVAGEEKMGSSRGLGAAPSSALGER